MNKCTDAQRSRILMELQKIRANTQVWDEFDAMDVGTASNVIDLFFRGHTDQALKQMRHLSIPV